MTEFYCCPNPECGNCCSEAGVCSGCGSTLEGEEDAVTFELAQIHCEAGGWGANIAPTPEEIDAAEKRWARRSYQHKPDDPDCVYQCGGCRFFAAAGADYGICWNEKSPLDGRVTFEHGGCNEHSYQEEV